MKLNFRWNVEEITKNESSEGQSYSLTGLNPFTKYAIYIKAYASTSSKFDVESEIEFFSTLPGTPEEVENFKAEPLSSTDIVRYLKKNNITLNAYLLFSS